MPGGVTEDEVEFARTLADRPFATVRYIGDPTQQEWRAARSAHAFIADDPVVPNGRLELRRYLREQSVARTRHRHGMLPPEA